MAETLERIRELLNLLTMAYHQRMKKESQLEKLREVSLLGVFSRKYKLAKVQHRELVDEEKEAFRELIAYITSLNV